MVYRGQDVNNGNLVAWNEVNTRSYGKKDMRRIMNEVTLLKTLSHPNLLAYYGGWANTAEQKVVFVTELMSSGTLKEFCSKYPIPLKTIKRYCKEILECISYLHTPEEAGKEPGSAKKDRLIHRDIKCENIFINAQGKGIKIGDLGLATSDGRSVMGTPEFMAPGALAVRARARAHALLPLPPLTRRNAAACRGTLRSLPPPNRNVRDGLHLHRGHLRLWHVPAGDGDSQDALH